MGEYTAADWDRQVEEDWRRQEQSAEAAEEYPAAHCAHGREDPEGCGECDLNVDCTWSEGGDCACSPERS